MEQRMRYPDVEARLKRRASLNHRSLEGEARHILQMRG